MSSFRPDVAPSSSGGLTLHQNGQIMTIPAGEVEAFIDDLRAVRSRQFVRECERVTREAKHERSI